MQNEFDENRIPLVILTGPTAVGKTALSIDLAKKLNAEIISADSMQVYKYMDIGTAKITPEEMNGVKHHLIDCFEPTYSFNVAEFKHLATELIRDIHSHGKMPMIVGGTGFYIQSVLYDVDFAEEEEDGYRDSLQKIAEEDGGTDKLYEMLLKVDPASTGIIHKNNVKRVIRALDFYNKNGYPISEHNEHERSKTSPYDFHYFVLNEEDRSILYDRIDRRVDIMFEQGLVEEVKSLLQMGLNGTHISMQGIGYKEFLPYVSEDNTFSDEDIEKIKYDIKLNTRHFAKRQLTWFRRERDVIWVDRKKSDEIYSVLKL
ncbi:MAG: tRNA (adenosine(37)-N6)-dimethylallyltransferase MiaA [Eubacterium sp.]|nr:tRNA (adenosine(37)-N6)-dimethylallyltransferase MiaA [Eubacterium sp.]